MIQLVTNFFSTFTHFIILVLPYFILGAVLSALLQSYLKTSVITNYINKGLGPIINACLLGAILPGCACTTMPMIEGLKSKVKSLGTISSFLMASPLLSPQTIILTYGLLGLKFTLGRILFALFGSITFGFICQQLQNKNVAGFHGNYLSHNHDHDHGSCTHTKHEHTSPFFKNLWKIFNRLGKYFFIGMILATLLTILIPNEAIPTYIGSAGLLSFLLALLIGIPLYVHEGEEILVTLSLITLGLDNGPAMTFLLGSIGTCIPTVIMAREVIGKNPSLLYVAFWLSFALIAGLIFQFI